MKQTLFESRYSTRWADFEAYLEPPPKAAGRAKSAATSAFPPTEFAVRYREICQHLALARDRQYSPDLVDRLNQLALGGHHELYSARGGERSRFLEFVVAGFPRLIRTEAKYVLLGALLFFGPLIALTFLVMWRPEIAYYFLSPRDIAEMQNMYAQAAERLGPRKADSDVMMFAYYIWNNVRIGFQTFAGGMLFGLGSLFFLVFNGATIGTVSGYLTQAGLGESFWSFVAGHSGMELTAIALSGAAVLRLAHALVAPGRRSRKLALVEAAQPAVRIMYGAAGMFVIAAVIEGFWSPHRYLPPEGKYAVGIVLWVMILLYFLFAGRGRNAA
ncbi:MAG: stage II sporulation protein M [Burkholderiales bacterium]